MAQVADVSASVVEEGDSETVSQLPRGRLSMVLAREACVTVRKVGEYRRMSRDLRRKSCSFVPNDEGDAVEDHRDSKVYHEAWGECGSLGVALMLVEVSKNLFMVVEKMFILYCERSVNVDSRLAWEINDLCDRLTDIIEEKENFVNELEELVGKFVPEKMCEFLKANQEKDMPNLMKLQILGIEFELRARKKNLFIERLKGNVGFLIMFIGCVNFM
nr:hypothetical protein [Tanacetum cinerariifolium]